MEDVESSVRCCPKTGRMYEPTPGAKLPATRRYHWFRFVGPMVGLGARIFYTTDGTAPTDHATLYTSPVQVPAGAVLKAVAMSDDLKDSDVVSSAK